MSDLLPRLRSAAQGLSPRSLAAALVVVLSIGVGVGTSGLPGQVEAIVAPAAQMAVAVPESGPLVTYPGTADPVAWPAHGSAALYLEGYGPVGASGATTPVPIASVAKAMTAYVILKGHPLAPGEQGATYTVTPEDVADTARRIADDHAVIEVSAGEVLTQRKMLEAIMLPSANNVSHMLARWDAGSVEAFLQKMNATAAELGMTQTHYTDPSGFDSGTVSTPADQVLLARAAMQDPTFAEIVGTPATTFQTAGTKRNTNKLLGQGGFVGLKTGTTNAAGSCLLFAVRRDVAGEQVTLYGIVLGQQSGQGARDAAWALADEGYQLPAHQEVAPVGTHVGTLTAPDGRSVPVVTSAPISSHGWGGQQLPAHTDLHEVELPIPAGTKVGTHTIETPRGPVTVDAVTAGALGGDEPGSERARGTDVPIPAQRNETTPAPAPAPAPAPDRTGGTGPDETPAVEDLPAMAVEPSAPSVPGDPGRAAEHWHVPAQAPAADGGVPSPAAADLPAEAGAGAGAGTGVGAGAPQG